MVRLWLTTSSSSSTTSTEPQQLSRSPLRSRGNYTSSRDQQHVDDFAAQQQQHSQVHSPRRCRVNSRDIPRTYSGLYGFSEDLLPFEVSRHRSWNALPDHLFLFLGTYVTLLAVTLSVSVLAVGNFATAWTVTNGIHAVVSLVYIHWLKGSLGDEQGEMNAMTVWEQLEATSGSRNVRRVFAVVPTLLCYAACHISHYDVQMSSINVAAWAVLMLAKLPFMNGVRIFGINRTAGIDDDDSNGGHPPEENSSTTSGLELEAPLLTGTTEEKKEDLPPVHYIGREKQNVMKKTKKDNKKMTKKTR